VIHPAHQSLLANLKHCANFCYMLLPCCRHWSSTLVMQACSQIGAYAGFASVMGRRLWRMLKLAGGCDLAGQRPAIVKGLL
jgi:hypothetical protein